MSYLVPLTLGACVYPVDDNEIKYLAVYKLLAEHEITFALMVPSILSYMRPYFEDIKLERLRYSLFCGEALYEDIIREWSRCAPNARIQNVYGPTEATIFCLAYDWKHGQCREKSANGIVSIGKPMKNTNAIIVDDAFVPVQQGIRGELCLSGGQLTSGYWNNPEKNQSAFFTCPQEKSVRFYRTGDMSYVDSDGDFVFCGRVDYQVKIQGYRVELHEVEHYARRYGEGYNVAAVAHENQTGQTVIHLFVEDGGACASEMIEYLKNHLPPYMIPSGVTSIDRLPLNGNGKIDRKKLIQLLADG
jgi:acyl-coenzyme A synthetase/AMP-(fatty) acid ligase